MNSSEFFVSVLKAAARLLLAAASFTFFKCAKLSIRVLLLLHYALHKQEALRWQFSSRETLQKPGVLPMIMTIGPRWNTHAFTATVGPISVRESLVFSAASAEKSAKCWTIVASKFPSYRTVAWIGSPDGPFNQGIARLNLGPGRYWIALRYYHYSERVELPQVSADDKIMVETRALAGNPNEYLRDLIHRRDFFYSCLHYYVYVLLRYRRHFPPLFVEREYLPLGNPETRFFYGALETGESLSVELDPGVLAAHDVYLTFYSLASFPIMWYAITEASHRTSAAEVPCSYLLRVHGCRRLERPFDPDWVRISVSDHDSP